MKEESSSIWTVRTRPLSNCISGPEKRSAKPIIRGPPNHIQFGFVRHEGVKNIRNRDCYEDCKQMQELFRYFHIRCKIFSNKKRFFLKFRRFYMGQSGSSKLIFLLEENIVLVLNKLKIKLQYLTKFKNKKQKIKNFFFI